MTTRQMDLATADYLKRNIKDILRDFPAVADILNTYNIGCVSCGLGTCLFKDIVEIHDLSPADEEALLKGIARIIFPGREVAIPATERKARPPTGGNYSPPMKKLVDEHVLIKRLIAVIPAFAAGLEITTESDRALVRQAIDFIQSYADKFHHAKEEAILFKYFDENLEIIKVMLADHENARSKVRAMLAALDKRDRATIVANLKAYAELLAEHIKKEDEILYRWMDKNLSTSQVGQMFSRFHEKDEEYSGTPQKYEAVVRTLEEKFLPKEA